MPYLTVRVKDEKENRENESEILKMMKLVNEAQDEEDLQDAQLLYKRLGPENIPIEERMDYLLAYEDKLIQFKKKEKSKGGVLANKFSKYIVDLYGGTAKRESLIHDDYVDVHAYIPASVDRTSFESAVQSFCDENGCSYELRDTANGDSPQLFSTNMKLKYPKVESYEKLEKQPKKLDLAKKLFKKSWGEEFNPESEDDREDIVLLYNEYAEDLQEWNEVLVRLEF